jgi:hypothetical protein
MKLSRIFIFVLVLIVSVYGGTVCKSQSGSPPLTKDQYDLLEEFLPKLKNRKVDTIIFCARRCIGCCDFFNIFWTENGNRYLAKTYDDLDFITHFDTITLKNDKVISMLGCNFDALKKATVKDNSHRNSDGSTSGWLSTHHCLNYFEIFLGTDSIKARLTDHSFEKYADASPYTKELTNDNYEENIGSVWNVFLTLVETELKEMLDPTSREVIYSRPNMIEN